MHHYRIYAKFEGQKKFEALDLSTGGQVKNLIYATLITESEIPKVQRIIEDNPNVEFQIRKIK
jgi:hypothetical protein